MAGPLHPTTCRRDRSAAYGTICDFVFIKRPHPRLIKTRHTPVGFHPERKTAATPAEAGSHLGSDLRA